MTLFEQQTRTVLRALTWLPTGGFLWFGASPPDRWGMTGHHPAVRFQMLVNSLYDGFYVHGGARPDPGEWPRADGQRGDPLLARLRAANTGRIARQSGWRLLGAEQAGGRVVVERAGLRLWLKPEEVDSTGGGAGEDVGIWLRPEQLRIAPGFYTVLGEAELAVDDTPLTRVYWHTDPEDAPLLLADLTGVLNERAIGFRVKVANSVQRFDRCDPLVVYLDPDDWPRVAPALAPIAARHTLAPDVPAYTKVLAAGVGVAEDDGHGMSFGQSRCSLLATALLDPACPRGETPDLEDAILEHVAAVFAAHGVDPSAPHLASPRADPYQSWASA